MKQTISFSDFCDAFRAYDRNNNFSYKGKRLLFDFLESIEEDTGQEIELDVIALCCEYDEYHWQDIADNYSIDLSDCDDDEEKEQAVIDYLLENTSYVGHTENGAHLYAAF